MRSSIGAEASEVSAVQMCSFTSGRDGDAFARQDGADPVGRPGALRRIVDAGEWLERDTVRASLGQAAAEIVPVAAHGERCRPDRAAEVEGENLAAPVAPELQRHERQQHRFAGAGRTDDKRMADIADVQGKPERGRAFGLAEHAAAARQDARRRSGPAHTARSGIMWARFSVRDRRLPDIGVDMSGQAAEPGVDRVDRLRHRGEVAALDDLLDQSQLLVG